jgi:hypothetical protein
VIAIPAIKMYSEEDKKVAKELFDTFTDGYMHAVVPFVVVNEEKAREELKKSRELLKRLV